MKRDFLLSLGISEDIAAKIMEENGNDIRREEGKLSKANETLSALTAERDELKTQINDVGGQLAQLKAVDVDGLKASLADISGKYSALEGEHKTAIAALTLDAHLREKLAGVRFTSEYARRGVYEEIKSKGVSLTDGKLTGYDEALSAIRETQPDAFIKEDTPEPPQSPVVVDFGRQHTPSNPAPPPAKPIENRLL